MIRISNLEACPIEIPSQIPSIFGGDLAGRLGSWSAQDVHAALHTPSGRIATYIPIGRKPVDGDRRQRPVSTRVLRSGLHRTSLIRSRLTSTMLLNPSSSSRRRFFSAVFATVFDSDLLDSRMRRPANQNSYHQTSPRWNVLMIHSCADPLFNAARIVLTSRNIF